MLNNYLIVLSKSKIGFKENIWHFTTFSDKSFGAVSEYKNNIIMTG